MAPPEGMRWNWVRAHHIRQILHLTVDGRQVITFRRGRISDKLPVAAHLRFNQHIEIARIVRNAAVAQNLLNQVELITMPKDLRSVRFSGTAQP